MKQLIVFPITALLFAVVGPFPMHESRGPHAATDGDIHVTNRTGFWNHTPSNTWAKLKFGPPTTVDDIAIKNIQITNLAIVGASGVSLSPKALDKWRIKFDAALPSKVVTTNTEVKQSAEVTFWLHWEIENSVERTRHTMRETFFIINRVMNWNDLVATNSNYIITPGGWVNPICTKEHTDTSVHEDVSYVQSNLVYEVTYKGMTNVQCIESFCIKTNVRKWKMEPTKIYLDDK